MHQPTIQPSAKPWGCSGGRRPGSRKDARQPQEVALAAWRALRRPFRRVSCRSAVVDETSSEVLRSRLLVQGVHRTLKPRSSKCFRDVPAANNLLDNVTMGLWRCANNTTGGRLVCVRQCYLEQLFGDIGKLLPGRRLAFANANDWLLLMPRSERVVALAPFCRRPPAANRHRGPVGTKQSPSVGCVAVLSRSSERLGPPMAALRQPIAGREACLRLRLDPDTGRR